MSVRLTLNRFPQNASIKDNSGVPWGCVVRPFAEPKDGGKLPTVAAEHVARCESCFGYVNPFCVFDRRTWRCSLCRSTNDVEERYSTYQLRSPLLELNYPIVELEMDDDDEINPEIPTAVYVAIVDLTGEEGYMELVKGAILASLEAVDENSMFGLITFSDKIGVYDMHREIPHVRNVAVPEDGVPSIGLEEILPLHEFLVSVKDFKDNISTAVESLQSVCPAVEDDGAQTPNSKKSLVANQKRALGSAISTFLEYIGQEEGLVGVHALTFVAGIPNLGLGALDSSRFSVDRCMDKGNKELLSPQTEFYKEQGEAAAALGCCIDLFVVSDRYCDLATLKFLSVRTGGNLMLYETMENATLPQDIYRQLHGDFAWRAMIRVRSSPEFNVADAYGHLNADESFENLWHIAGCGTKKCFAFDFAFTTPSGFGGDPDAIPTMQVAFAYSHCVEKKVKRKLRIITFQLGIGRSSQEVYESADPSVITALMVQKIIRASLDDGIAEARMLITDWLTILLQFYNETYMTSQENPDMEFWNARPLQGLSRLVFGLLNNNVLSNDNVHPDERIYLQCMFSGIRPEFLSRALYPSMCSYTTHDDKAAETLALSKESLVKLPKSVFLLDSFTRIYVYYPESTEITYPPSHDSDLRQEVNQLKADRIVTPRVVFAKADSADGRQFEMFLIEDEGVRGAGYKTFLASIKPKVQEMLLKKALG